MFGKKISKKELDKMESINSKEDEIKDLITFEEEPDLSNVVKSFDIFGEGDSIA